MQSSTSEDYELQQQEVDRAEVNQLARMMPDPEEDELFDDGMLHPRIISIHAAWCWFCHPMLRCAVLSLVSKARYTHHSHFTQGLVK